MELNFQDHYITMTIIFLCQIILVIGDLTLLYLLVKFISNVGQDLLKKNHLILI
jgi:hypothetical protein